MRRSSPEPSCSRMVRRYPAMETSTQVPSPRAVRASSRFCKHADAECIDEAKVPVHAQDASERGSQELPVAQQYGDASRLRVITRSHGAVHKRPELPAQVVEGLREFRHLR
jgi:hypothetical protein